MLAIMVGLDGNQVEEGRREIGALIRGADACRLQRAGVAVARCDRGHESVRRAGQSSSVQSLGMSFASCISS